VTFDEFDKQDWHDEHPRDRARMAWNAALDEAAKVLDARRLNPQHASVTDVLFDLARTILAIQTTAGAAGGEGK
jgi:hypothetical protein